MSSAGDEKIKPASPSSSSPPVRCAPPSLDLGLVTHVMENSHLSNSHSVKASSSPADGTISLTHTSTCIICFLCVLNQINHPYRVFVLPTSTYSET